VAKPPKPKLPLDIHHVHLRTRKLEILKTVEVRVMHNSINMFIVI
jgi:hypothetical protein